jgi:hypothetical protein
MLRFMGLSLLQDGQSFAPDAGMYNPPALHKTKLRRADALQHAGFPARHTTTISSSGFLPGSTAAKAVF